MALLSDSDIGLGGGGPVAPTSNLPRGIRSNNPGNLRPPGQDVGFQQFNTMQEGVNAADKQLEIYGSKYGIGTLAQAVTKWAPPKENPTAKYIAQVSSATGIDPHDPLDLSDPQVRSKVRDAMLDFETPGWRNHLKPEKGLLSDADLGLVTKNEPLPQVASQPKPKVDEAGAGHFLKRAGKDLAGLADMVASIPGGMLSTLSGLAQETFTPLPLTAKQAQEQQASSAATRSAVAAVTTSPVEKVMHLMGHKEGYTDSDIGKVQSKLQQWIEKGSDWISEHSGGVASAQQIQVLANDMMNLSPLGFSKFMRGERARLSPEELKSGRISDKTAADILGKYTEEHGNPTKETVASIQEKMHDQLTRKSDAEIGAEAKAHDLIARGASVREVEAAIKRSPLVGKKLDEFMARRQASIEAMQKTPPSPQVDPSAPQPGPARGMLSPEAQMALKRQQIAAAARARPAIDPQFRNAPRGGVADARPMGDTGPFQPGPPRADFPRARGMFRGPMKGQRGGVDTRALLGLAAVTGGATLGATMAGNEKLEGAILGGAGGLALAMLPGYASRVSGNWTRALKLGATTGAVAYGLSQLDKDHPVEGAVLGMLWGASHLAPRAKVPMVGDMSIDELVNARNGAIAVQERQVSNTSWAMRTAVPDEARRVAIAEAVERGDIRGLSSQEQKVAQAYRGFTKTFGEAAQNAGVLKDLVQNYVTHVVEREALPQTKVQEVMDALFGGADAASGGARSTSGFAKHRKYGSFQELEKALDGSGLKIKTKDIADLVDIYGRSMARAVENKKLFDNLKAAKDGQGKGRPFVQAADKAPASYQVVNTPQLQGMRVHPDIAPALRFVAESYRPGYVTRGLLSLSLAQKRLSTSLSLFHAQNLINAYAGASGVRTLRMIPDINAALDAYRKGGLGDSIDTLLQGGLKIERPMEADLQSGKKLGMALDQLVNSTLGTKFSAFEKGFGGVEKLQRETFDKLTWDYLHSGLKLALATREFEKGLRDHPDWPKEKVAQQVSSFVNDTFGGLDWYRVASETQTQIGRQIAMSLLSPKGRAGLQLLMFAPDWTMSTFRAMYKALPGSSSMPLTTRLHQKYVMRTALIWATLMNGYNIAASGHPIWDNKDPTKIEWRDGTTQQIAKHAMEGPEWLLNPRQTALNKLGIPVKEAMEQLTGQEYMTAQGRGIPMQESRAAHLAKSVAPLSLQSGSSPGRTTGETLKRAALSTLGMPVYRMSAEEKKAASEERRRENRRKRKTYGSKR